MTTTSQTVFRKEAGTEPLPGYRLVEPLGKGGFGEVWKCEVPGGLFKAVKFVRNEATAAGQPSSLQQELEAFQSVKAIRHPFILSIERVEMIDGEMVTVMELADHNLQDRLVQCQADGLAGIPREELLGCLVEAAEALDVMNTQYGLLHLDVKPSNLFVVSNHLKVGDFGLVHRLGQRGQEDARREGGVTPLYVAPETLQGRFHRHSDQYNLGLAYQELLTGVHPCAGEHPRQVMMLHLTGQPNLGPLPEADRPCVARALSKDPDQRFPSCMTFVLALLAGQESAGNSAVRLGAFRPVVSVVPDSGVELKRVDDTHPGPAPTQPLRRPPPQALTPLPPASAPAGMLPGYEVLDCLSRGALGEVWRVRAGDGRYRLARFVAPALCGDDAAKQRLTNFVGALRHRALPAVELTSGNAGQVVLLTDLIERSLQERFRECHEAGAAGIPRPELLEHLGEAAEALDVLHGRHGAQHLGLTPRLLLLSDDRLRIADYGLLDLLRRAGGRLPTPGGGHYMAPELSEGTASRTCDQYSLALIYAELLTGIHPRVGRTRGTAGRGSVVKVAFDFLTVTDRAVLGQALDPDPEKRFASCAELFEALEGTHHSSGSRSGKRRPPRIRPFAELQGKLAVSSVVPTTRQFRDAILAAATQSEAPGGGGSGTVQYLRRAGSVWEARFPMKVLPGVVRLKLTALREQWGALLVHEEETCYRLQIREPASFWQRCLGQESGLEMELRLTPGQGGEPGLVEVVMTVGPLGDGKGALAQQLPELGPKMLTQARDQLQNVGEKRADTRWPSSARVHAYPVGADGEVGKPVEGICRDISPRGLRFSAEHAPDPGYAYLHFPEAPGLAGFVLLAKIVRVYADEEENVVAAVFSLGEATTEKSADGGKKAP
jgi:serine/threonine protein kinase